MVKINNTKIQYLSVADKIYKVIDIDFCDLIIEASKTDLTISDVPGNEVFPTEDFEEFKIRLCNGGGTGVIVDMGEWMERHKKNVHALNE